MNGVHDTDASQPAQQSGVEESLSTYFDKSVTIVRQYADLIEQDYAQPALRLASLKFREKPITMTFLSVFMGLSAFPLLSFVGLTVFTLSSIVFLALIFGAIAFITIEAVLVAFLVFTLWSLFITASFTTAIVVFVYGIMRLGMLIAHEGPSGFTDWAHETHQYIFYARTREATDESDESAILVDGVDPNSKKIKVEEESLQDN